MSITTKEAFGALWNNTKASSKVAGNKTANYFTRLGKAFAGQTHTKDNQNEIQQQKDDTCRDATTQTEPLYCLRANIN